MISKKNKKIDILLKHLNGFYKYECSTTWSKTCKEAKNSFLLKHNYLNNDQVKAVFSKE